MLTESALYWLHDEWQRTKATEAAYVMAEGMISQVAVARSWPSSVMDVGLQILDSVDLGLSEPDYWLSLAQTWAQAGARFDVPEGWAELGRVWVSLSEGAALEEALEAEHSALQVLLDTIAASAEDLRAIGEKAGKIGDNVTSPLGLAALGLLGLGALFLASKK